MIASTTDPRSFHRLSSGEQAARYIRQLIFDGRLGPGSHVPQDEIATELEMSRIPIREALIALERQGWVHIERHRGAFVHALDRSAVSDHYELYGLLYGFAVRRAIERADDALPAQLHAIARTMPELAEDPVAFGSATRAFHGAVVSAARSPRVAVALRSLSSLVPGEFFVHVPGSVSVEQKGVREISRAVKRADVDRATTAYVAMLRPIGRLVIDLFEARGLFDGTEDRADGTTP